MGKFIYKKKDIDKLSISARLIAKEAMKMGITVETFDDFHLLLLKRGGVEHYIRGSRTSLQSSVGFTISQNKWLTKQILLKHGLPTAKGLMVRTEKELLLLQKEMRYPLVLKPLDGHQGKDVLVGIKDVEELLSAFLSLRQKKYRKIIVEELIPGGNDFRIFVAGYKVVAAAMRVPAHVVGNGLNSIQELIEEKNEHKWRGKGHFSPLTVIVVDKLVEDNLHEQNLDINSVVDDGKIIYLRKTANLSTGGEAWDVTDSICKENINILEKVARVCDLSTAGIDVMAKDLSIPLKEQNGGIIEVNASPGLRMHVYPIKGQSRNVAVDIIDMLFGRKDD